MVGQVETMQLISVSGPEGEGVVGGGDGTVGAHKDVVQGGAKVGHLETY